MGPKWSATGPSAATGRKSRAPMIRIVPNNSMLNVGVSSLSVPRPKGLDFFSPRYAAMAIGAIIGINLLNIITRPAAISHATAVGAGFGLFQKPYVVASPSKAEPLLAEAEENWYRICERPCAPGLLT